MSDDATEAEVKGWPAAFCSKCRRLFPQPESWARTCPTCFKADKGYKILAGDKAFLWAQMEIQRLQEDVKSLQAEIMRQDAELRHRPASSPPVDPRATAALEALTPGVLRDIILLTHPDRHDNSERANRTTQILLDLRTKLK